MLQHKSLIFIVTCKLGVVACKLLVMACSIFSCGMWTLSYSMWGLVHWQGIEFGPSVLGISSISQWSTMEFPSSFFLFFFTHYCKTVPYIYRHSNICWILNALMIFTCSENNMQFHSCCSSSKYSVITTWKV